LPSILFFLGILLAVAALESLGLLFNFAEGLNETIPNTDVVIGLLGIGSAVIDNVPLVAASMGMFSMSTDDPVWHLIAYSAGTGGEHAHHRFRGRGSSHGNGENRFLLVFKENSLVGLCWLYWWIYNFCPYSRFCTLGDRTENFL
jgi:hypothetical protein